MPRGGADPDTPVVTNSLGAGGWVDPDVFSHSVRCIGRAAGLLGVHPHLLRSTYATLLLAQGVDLAVVSAILGHESVALTARIYANVLDSTKREGLDVLASLYQAHVAPTWLPRGSHVAPKRRRGGPGRLGTGGLTG